MRRIEIVIIVILLCVPLFGPWVVSTAAGALAAEGTWLIPASLAGTILAVWKAMKA